MVKKLTGTRPTWQKVLVLCILAMAVLIFFFNKKGYTQNPSYLSGDEPHYVMMTDSLVKDGDFNLKNDYQLHRSIAYYPVSDLFPHLSALADKNSNSWYSIHTIGLPILLYVPYRFWGVEGARIWMIAIQFASIVLFYCIAKKYIRSQRQQVFGVILLASCPLFWQNLGAMFPDLVLVTIWGASIVLFGRKDRLSNAAMAALLVLGTLVHTKGMVLIAPIILANFGWHIYKKGFSTWLKTYAASIAILAVGVLWYAYFLHAHYGTINPAGLYGKHGQLFSANPITNIIAVLTDRSKGLLLYFPVLLISGPYFFMAIAQGFEFAKKLLKKKVSFTQNHFLLAGLLAGLGVYLITQIGFLDWSGSTAPNGRYMLPLVFAAIFVIAKYANLVNKLQVWLLGTFAALSVYLSWYSIVNGKYYMTTGVNSFWVDRHRILMHLPLFNLTSSIHAHAQVVRGAELLCLVLIGNIGLFILYKYQVTFRKRAVYAGK